MNHLTGFRIYVAGWMVGAKYARKYGRQLWVSPAMWSLMKGATPDELDHLMRHLRVVEMSQEPLPAFMTLDQSP